MASAAKSTTLSSKSGYNYTLRAYFGEESTNISENYSVVYVEAGLTSNGSRWSSSYPGKLKVYWHDNRENYDRFVAELSASSIEKNGTIYAYGSIIVYHNNDGNLSGYAYAVWEHGSGTSSYEPNTGGVTTDWTALTYIPRQATVTGANNFNSNQNPYMTYNNLGGFKINLRLEFGGTSIQRGPFYSTSGEYTFELTDEERQLLYSKCTTSNTLTVRYVVGTCIGSDNETHWSWLDRTMTVVNSNPNFEYFEFEDVNELTLALTGNNQNIIKGYSNVKVTVPVSNKAEAINGATMRKYRAEIGTATSKEFDYSDSENVSAIVTGANSATIKCYAIDSRNNSTPLEKQAYTFIDYSVIEKGEIDVNRTNGVSEEVTLKFNGKYSNVDFGVKQNSIISAKYRYSVANKNDWSEWEDLEVTQGSGSFSFEGTIKGDTETLGFDIGNSYDIEVIVEDELTSIKFTDTFGSGIPNLALHKNGVGIMGAYDVDVGGPLQVEGENILKRFNYSEEEQIIGTWTNGKPIYRSIIDVTMPTGTQDTYDVSDLNIDNLINISGVSKNSRPLNFYVNFGGVDYWSSVWLYEKKTIYINCSESYGGTSEKIILEYTKTTDEATTSINEKI